MRVSSCPFLCLCLPVVCAHTLLLPHVCARVPTICVFSLFVHPICMGLSTVYFVCVWFSIDCVCSSALYVQGHSVPICICPWFVSVCPTLSSALPLSPPLSVSLRFSVPRLRLPLPSATNHLHVMFKKNITLPYFGLKLGRLSWTKAPCPTDGPHRRRLNARQLSACSRPRTKGLVFGQHAHSRPVSVQHRSRRRTKKNVFRLHGDLTPLRTAPHGFREKTHSIRLVHFCVSIPGMGHKACQLSARSGRRSHSLCQLYNSVGYRIQSLDISYRT